MHPKPIPQTAPVYACREVETRALPPGLSFGESLGSAPHKCNSPACEWFEQRSAAELALRVGEELKLAPAR